ncbi:Hint domain-containing protein [uncultured Shimia sp.]|uniref:Hint domain-containing protein n=1 Tax=uncultured Shimia sp. TaxID=573152 RepID=UPI002619CA9E|nr:Hint domain-containing protein [uncultured Shimia sp.]
MLNETQFVLEVDGAEIQAAPDFCYSGNSRPKAGTLAQVGSVAGDAIIKTIEGEKPASTLRVGDILLTRDNGYQPVRWVGSAVFRGIERHQSMLRLQAGALGPGIPSRDLSLSPHQRVLTKADTQNNQTTQTEALTRARDLKHLEGVTYDRDLAVADGWNILMDRHELILANDVWTETFQPDRKLMSEALAPVREALQKACPNLAKQGCQRAFPSARETSRLFQS